MNNERLTRTEKKQQAEAQMRHEDLLDNRLYDALQVMSKPAKWGMNKDGSFTELYPCPVFKDGRVSGVEYRTNKAVELPEELLERLCILEDELEALAPKVKAPKQIKGRPAKFSHEDATKMIELREQGVTYSELAEMFGVSGTTVSNYIRKQNRKQKEATA
ncbi:helix-turn-helix domain-containing protein [Priestia megaterium]|uniref:helix-turn-helix domain-containing protein n=1 Tax=Priestia megaterium TaxID=1404 RepID=UPI001C23F8C5|nr:helix-turn-helix domain-containing protein [Priestia megaterium]MBU8690575.1 helix-turn-helix domain-containing protein [Priestia megaterium]